MIIDSHCHLFLSQFDEDFHETYLRAKSERVEKFLMVGCNPKSNIKVLNLRESYNDFYPTIGLHPADVNDFSDDDLILLEEQVKSNKVYAIGECGLDYYWHSDNKEKQIKFFIFQIELSIKYNLPLVIHCRDAMQDMYDILSKYKGKIKFVMHGYSGSLEMAKLFISLGGKIGIGGVVTFKNAKNVHQTVEGISINDILLETDCPYLTPEPFRGKRNEPSYLKYISLRIATIKNIGFEEVESITSNNSIELFNLID